MCMGSVADVRHAKVSMIPCSLLGKDVTRNAARYICRRPSLAHLHVSPHAQQQAQVNTQGTDVGSRLASNPEHDQMALLVVLKHLALVDGANAQLALDRGDDGRPLEQSTLRVVGMQSASCPASTTAGPGPVPDHMPG